MRILAALTVILVSASLCAAQESKQAKSKTTDGKIKALALDKDELVLVGKADSKDHKFSVTTNAKVRVNAKEGRLADLKVGDEVSVTWRSEGDRKVVLAITTLRKQQ